MTPGLESKLKRSPPSVRDARARVSSLAMAHFQHTCNACLKPICEGDVYITRCGHRFCERPRDHDVLRPPLFSSAPRPLLTRGRLTPSAPPTRDAQATTTREGCVSRESARRAARRSTGSRIFRCAARPDRAKTQLCIDYFDRPLARRVFPRTPATRSPTPSAGTTRARS